MKSAFGLSEKIASVLCYAFGWVSGIVFLIMERGNKTVRFHALQSTVYFLALTIINRVVSILPLVGGLLSWAVGVVAFVSWVYLMFMSYKGTTFKIPVIGDVVWDQVNK